MQYNDERNSSSDLCCSMFDSGWHYFIKCVLYCFRLKHAIMQQQNLMTKHNIGAKLLTWRHQNKTLLFAFSSHLHLTNVFNDKENCWYDTVLVLNESCIFIGNLINCCFSLAQKRINVGLLIFCYKGISDTFFLIKIEI